MASFAKDYENENVFDGFLNAIFSVIHNFPVYTFDDVLHMYEGRFQFICKILAKMSEEYNDEMRELEARRLAHGNPKSLG